MKASEIKGELNVYYQAKCYSWSELCLQIENLNLPDKNNEYAVLITQAQDVFATLIYLLYGFKEKITIFPVSSESSVTDSSDIDSFAANSFDIALAIATSGSQAKPKIALISRQNIIAHCQSFVKVIPIDHSSVWLNCMPLNHIAGVMIVYRCWFNNASIVLHDNFHTEKVWLDIKLYAVSHISLVPRMLFKLLEFSQDAKPPESLKYVIIGGDRLSDALYQRAASAGWPIFISYGMTEACSTIAIGKTQDKLKILDDISTQLTGDGVLKIKGPMIFSAYADFKTELYERKWFVTHDKVNLKGGYLSIIGRDDDMIICGGKNIAPEFIESLFIDSSALLNQTSSHVLADLAIGKYKNSSYSDNDSKQSWGDTVVALYCGDVDELECWIKNNIQTAYQPRRLLAVKKIPRNSIGKINRKAVQTIINNYYK
ncbi:MAG: AMP-binding protein [Thiotrichaceae bacterium]|nr:AMP-binding protein [Thiotrichaceae bacterium]